MIETMPITDISENEWIAGMLYGMFLAFVWMMLPLGWAFFVKWISPVFKRPT